MPPTFPHIAPPSMNVADTDVPDPQFGGLDIEVLTSLLGGPTLQAARWASFSKEQEKTITTLRAQVAALKAKLSPTVAAPEPVTVTTAATATVNGKKD